MKTIKLMLCTIVPIAVCLAFMHYANPKSKPSDLAEPMIDITDRIQEGTDFLGRKVNAFLIDETETDALVFSYNADATYIQTYENEYWLVGYGEREGYQYSIGTDVDMNSIPFHNYKRSQKLQYGIDDDLIIFRFDNEIATVKHLEGKRTTKEAALLLDAGLKSEMTTSEKQDISENLYVNATGDTIFCDSIVVRNKDEQIKIRQNKDDHATYIGSYRIYILSSAEETLKYLEQLQDADMIHDIQTVNGFSLYELNDRTQMALKKLGNKYIYFPRCTTHLLEGLDISET